MSNRELPAIAKELIAAKRLIEDPSKWWNGHVYDDSVEFPCALLALNDCATESILALDKSAWALFGRPTTMVNDQLGHAAVMQMYDHAIAKALRP